MLPDLSSLSSMHVSFRRLFRTVATVLVCLMISAGLSACVGSDQPPRSVLLSALGQQIQLTQTSIARSLDLEAAGVPEVSRVRLEDQDVIRIGEQKGMHLTGRFDWRLPGDAVKVDSAFELYLERGERGESWRLAIPSGSDDGASQAWVTYPLAID
ncbi:hypothetical protein SynPROS71_01240 [Synechococcus sp. PROS-7-1]|uniref:hypothetical protein n=1 Tax=Synechococcus sp. PROS-7-1 TaxID=1442556 RepID=UPI001648BC07|nr:hypothetical protein [Synechococcus sp. PROS-7-1]QNI85043.1 hypothetical protein SynPROS71_01240 [Synechococcus sp. PROS-7-1]